MQTDCLPKILITGKTVKKSIFKTMILMILVNSFHLPENQPKKCMDRGWITSKMAWLVLNIV